MTKLSVNVNKIATLRNTRPWLGIPSVVRAAETCLVAGAHGITVHPRPDQRHITRSDVEQIADLLRRHPHVEYNIEGNPFFGDYLSLIAQVRPAQCTLVPDTPEAATSDHGWDILRDAQRLRPAIESIRAIGCRVSLFMDGGAGGMDELKRMGVDRIELYTEPFARAHAAGDAAAAATYAETARQAQDAGLGVNAGHDLNLLNLRPFLHAVPNVLEVSIGHALIADALDWGLAETVRKYLAALS